MKFSMLSLCTRVLVVLVVCGIALSESALAQMGPQSAVGSTGNSQQNLNSQQWILRMGDVQVDTARISSKEMSAYKAFYAAQDVDQRIHLGQSFVQKFPSSVLLGAVHAEMVRMYFTKQDWVNFHASADKALDANPDNVDVLTTVGWVIPHAYNPSDPNGKNDLDRAERYEKHAIELIGKMSKPKGITDAQFSTFKAQELTEAHSGLGLVYFRRQDFDESVKELQQATQTASAPDPADMYALGAGLFNLKRYNEAVVAFAKCAEAPNDLQEVCKQKLDDAKKAAGQLK